MSATASNRVDEYGDDAPWPRHVTGAWLRSIGEARGPDAQTPLPLAPGWLLARDALGGSVLFMHDEASGALLRCAEADASGNLHAVARWESASADAPRRLAWARLRFPGGWLELEPGTARHALWGPSDRLLVGSESPASFAAQPWEALRCIPALDRPAALPLGVGETALNWLGALAADQGRESLHYVGPYPTAHLFDALRRSFRPLDAEETARERFSRDELPLAWSGAMAESRVAWAPDPFLSACAAPDVLVRHRRGLETVWIGAVPFRRSRSGQGRAGGARLREESPGGPVVAGLVLLGEPFRDALVLDPRGRLLEDRRGAVADGGDREPGEPLDPQWREALAAWCAVGAPLPLAPFVLEAAEALTLRWAALPYSLAARRGDVILVQSGLARQFRRLAPSRPAAELALMLFSDAAQGVAPPLLAAAQEALAERPRARSLDDLLRAGERAQTEARQRLEAALPRLIRALSEGRCLGTNARS